MDFIAISSGFTVVIFLMYIGIVIWAYSKKTKPRFDEAANLVFADEEVKSKEEQEAGVIEK